MSESLPSDVEPTERTEFDASDPKHVRERAIKGKRLDKERLLTIRGMMDVQSVRKYLWGLLTQAHVFASSFHPNATTMAFREGERNLGLAILADIMAAAPEHYVLMARENAAD